MFKTKFCREGEFLYSTNDVYIGRSLDLYGEYSQGEVDVFDHLVKPGMHALDIGANIGTHTIALSKRVGPEGLVFAFEPQRLNYYTLCGNIALNSLMNVEALRYGLGEKEEIKNFPNYDPNFEGNFGGLTFTDSGIPTLIKRLDDFELKRCGFIKLDVEGMEEEVLRGGSDTIKRTRPIMYIENNMKIDPNPDKGQSLIDYLKSIDYQCYWHFPALFNPNNFLSNPENIFPNISSHNMLCAPKELPVKVEGLEHV